MSLPPRAVAPVLAAGAGLALVGAHPPLGWWPLSFVAPALLLAALWAQHRQAACTGRPARWIAAFGLGALMGAAAFAPMLSWLIMPAGYLGWGLLVGIQIAWFGLLAVLARPVAEHRLAPLALAALWTGIDAWRAIVPFNGFEWGAIAYAHVDGSWMLPVARVLGGRAITFLVVLIGAAAALAIRTMWRAARADDDLPMEQRLRSANLPIALVVGGLLVSVLVTVEPPAEQGSIEVLAVQGNDVRHWEEGAATGDTPLRIATALRDETLDAVRRDGVPDLTVWPESSLDRDPMTERGAPLGALADEVAAEVGTLLAGATLDGPDPQVNRYVTAIVLQDGLDERDRYVKRRLVPFGEYIPMRRWLDWYPPLDQVPRDTIPGGSADTLEIGGIRVAAIVCFETMFTDIVRTNVLADDDPAQILITVTNDASFGDTAEPAQHLAQSRLRAVETGRWTVHAAQSGSSAFVSPTGALDQATEVFTIDSIRAEVPLVDGLTPYLAIGDVVGWVTRLLTLAALALLVVLGVRGRSRRTRTLAAGDRGGPDGDEPSVTLAPQPATTRPGDARAAKGGARRR